MGKKVVIVGGVAGGASTAARLRRLDETAQIILLERGDHISYANCGLPYYIGEAIKERDALFVMTPEKFRAWFNVEVRVRHEVTAIDRASQKVLVVDHRTGEEYSEQYDYLVLSPGAEPLRPPLPGIDHGAIFTLRSVADTDRIYAYIRDRRPQTAVVIGGGFIGLEMAENLHGRGLAVTVVEMAPQLLPPADPEIAALVQNYLRAMGVALRLGDGVKQFHAAENGAVDVELQSGARLPADLVLLAIGVRPEVKLAREAGLEVGRGIKVNEYLQSSDPCIYALGDAIELPHLVTGEPAVIPLAGPANKQGRIVANNIAGRKDSYRGTQGTAVLKIFAMTVSLTGANERMLQQAGIDYRTCIVHPQSHAGYYPGSSQMTLKLIFNHEGKILGAQAAGFSGVDKRIDVIAAAMRAGCSVYDLQELELAYAPPFSTAKDPVNIAGFVAANTLNGDLVTVESAELLQGLPPAVQLLDVREAEEYALGYIDGAVNMPLGELRQRCGELDPEREVIVYCSVGLRSYLAARILMQNGFKRVRTLNGGYKVYRTLAGSAGEHGAGAAGAAPGQAAEEAAAGQETVPAEGAIKLDLSGLQCPGPIMQLFRKMSELPEGALVAVSATDPGFAADIESWCNRTGNRLLSRGYEGKVFTALICKGQQAATAAAPAAGRAPASASASGDDKTIIVFSGDLDRAMAALIIANGAAAMGRRVMLFFTFWGLNILRKSEGAAVRKPFMERMFGLMMPRGSKKLGLSRLHMLGIGPKLIRREMQRKNISSLEELLAAARAAGVRLVACQMSMDVMGIKKDELIEGVEVGGVATYLDAAEGANVNLFI
ncbi:MAG: FAD-dependent oxidoreductase [Firmicutes bacterium]|jgi:NADPH-dependent 2,4-dienoyl-CoA reductase/sulfur reductase-like enzyme/peroxiredoxin family protein/TusA-related sulfurtransferase|nr:FAD-dependent oxidoreductase [Bacillota bacterium]